MEKFLLSEAQLIEKHYSALMDSVNLINSLLMLESLDTEQKDTIKRNVKHLQIMLGKDFWTTEDLEPARRAVLAGESFLTPP